LEYKLSKRSLLFFVDDGVANCGSQRDERTTSKNVMAQLLVNVGTVMFTAPACVDAEEEAC
jgi:hypothetical protein